MGKPKVKIKANRKDANDGKVMLVHSYNREIQHLGKPKVKIKVNTKAVEGAYVHNIKGIGAHASTSRKSHIGKPKVKIKQVRGLWMGKPKVKMKK